VVIGADGRNSVVRGQAGIDLHRDPAHHLFTGLLVEDAEGWDDAVQATGTEGSLNFLVFPQGQGRVRLYLSFGYDERSRFAGAEGPRSFIEAFRFATLPNCEALADATPAGPVHAYPNEDTWTDPPYAEGVVLIGDAAGWNDPIIGQGLSITLRDVRIVGDLLKGSDAWSPALLAPYAEERAERMRRLRFAATIIAKIDCEFGPEGEAQRKRARARMDADPSLNVPLIAVMAGPEHAPAEGFTPEVMERIFGE
jgi:2-polyprenyl-6-methoxyphenol hydroxylase-like FAD-dependent oxidoreductase